MLLSTAEFSGDFTGLDLMILQAWAVKCFQNQPSSPRFVLRYWDLRPPNIILDNHRLARFPLNSITLLISSVVDWDDVYPVPLKYSAITLGTKMFGYVRSLDYVDFLNPIQEEEFQREFIRIEQERSNSSVMSKLYSQSKNFFLDYVLREYSLLKLQKRFPEELAQALRRTPENVRAGIVEWEEFVRVFFTNQGRELPDWPMYLKIQHELGVKGSSEYRQAIRRKVQASLVQMMQKISRNYPQLDWARRTPCYLEAALLDRRSCGGIQRRDL